MQIVWDVNAAVWNVVTLSFEFSYEGWCCRLRRPWMYVEAQLHSAALALPSLISCEITLCNTCTSDTKRSLGDGGRWKLRANRSLPFYGTPTYSFPLTPLSIFHQAISGRRLLLAQLGLWLGQSCLGAQADQERTWERIGSAYWALWWSLGSCPHAQRIGWAVTNSRGGALALVAKKMNSVRALGHDRTISLPPYLCSFPSPGSALNLL